MKLGAIFVQIGANLKPLQAGMKKAQAIVIASAKKMGAAGFRFIGNAFKSIFSNIVKYAKYAALALVGFFALSIKKAAEQESAEFKLAAAIATKTKKVNETLSAFKQYASELQKVTTQGDEATLALMQMAISMGVQIKDVPKVVKGAVAMSKAFNIDANSLVKMIALANMGEYTMLQRYVPALRAATTETEKAAILQQTMADAMKVAESETWTFSGSFTQLKNTIGDAMEKIGGPFLKTLTRVFKQMKTWIEANGPMFDAWGEKINAVLQTVMVHLGWLFNTIKSGNWDALKKYLSAMFEELKGGLSVAFESLSPVATQLGVLIGQGIVTGIKGVASAAFGGGGEPTVKGNAMKVGAGVVAGGMAAGPYGAVAGGAAVAGTIISQEVSGNIKLMSAAANALSEYTRQLVRLGAKNMGVSL